MDTSKMIVEKGKAGYPAVYLLSPEEQRSLREIKKAAKELKRNLFVWTVGKGLAQEYDPTKDDDSPGRGKRAAPPAETKYMDDTETATAVLEKMKTLPEASIIVLRLFHHFLDDPLIQSWFLDLIPKYKLSKRMALVLTPVLKIPTELDKDFSLVEFALPTKAELVPVLEGILKGIDAKLQPDDDKKNHLIEAARGLTTTEAENAITLSIVRPRMLNPDEKVNIWDSKIVMEEKCQALKKSGVLEYIPVSLHGLSAVGGMDNLKEFVKKRRRAFTDEAKLFGLPPPKGILVIGPPGTGKSLGAKAVSSELDLPLLKLDMGKVYGGLVGQSESNIRMALATAEALSPCVLWVDEIEKGMAGGDGSALDSGVGARVLGTVLTWMQEKTAPVFVYATANRPNLPPELVRKGRFDEMFSVDLPTPTERKEIFRIHLDRRSLTEVSSMADAIDTLVLQSDLFTGAEIEAAVVDAMYTAFDANRKTNLYDVVGALQETQPQAKIMAAKIEEIRKWCKGNTRPANRADISSVIGGNRTIEA